MSEGYRYLFLHSLAVFMKRSSWVWMNIFGELKWDLSHHHKAHDGLPSIHHKTPSAAAAACIKTWSTASECKMSRDSSGFPLGLSVFCQGFDNFGIQGLWPRSVIEKIGCNCQKVGQFEKRACTVIEFESVNFSPLFHVAKCIFHPQCFCKYCWRGQAAPGSDVVRVTVTLIQKNN